MVEAENCGSRRLEPAQRCSLVPAVSRHPDCDTMEPASHNNRAPRLNTRVIPVFRLLCSFRASVSLAALGALVSISSCAAYPAGGSSELGYASPYYAPGYAYAPGFGYSDFDAGLGFGPEHHFHHDHDFDDRFHAGHRIHGQAMMGEPGHPAFFHHPPGGFHGPGPHPGVGGGGEFHARAANPAPPLHPGGGRGNFNH